MFNWKEMILLLLVGLPDLAVMVEEAEGMA